MATRQEYYTVEYAQSDRSACKITKKTIAQGAVRISRNVPSPFHDGYMAQWCLPAAFFGKYGKKIQSLGEIRGFFNLRLRDQNKLRELHGEKPVEDAAIEEADNALWSVRGGLAKLTPTQLKSNLDANGIHSEGGRERLVARVANGVIYGKAHCSTCSHKDLCQMKYVDGQYECKAELQWGYCGYKVTTYRRDPKFPLKGLRFAVAGRLHKRTPMEFKQTVTSHGGVFSDNITADLDYVIATYTSVHADTPRVQQALKLGLAIVSELLLDRLLAEFGFDQSPYLLAGELPPIAFATLYVPLPLASASADAKPKVSGMGAMGVRLGTIDASAGVPHGTIHKDSNGEAFEVLLNQTDIVSGQNKFYLLQIINNGNKSKNFILFRKWGRLGTTAGGSAVSAPASFDTTLEQFEKIYEERTGNTWAERKNFKKMPGKYFPVEASSGEEDAENPNSDVNDDHASYLDPRVRSVIDLIFDTDMMKREMAALEIDVNKMPLGKLSSERLRNGYEVLRQIETQLKEMISSGTSNSSYEVALRNLTNQFYTLIPTDMGNRLPEIIDTFEVLRRKMRQLEALVDIEVAKSLIANQSVVGMHTADANYVKLGTSLTPLSRYSRDFKTVEKYVSNSHDSSALGYRINVQDVYTVRSGPGTDDFADYKTIRPRMLLWHGSRLCNFAGILNQGLRIAPPEAPTSGYLFGKGIYFADRVQKSIAFCHPTKENPTALLLLVEVVVGNPYQVSKPEYMESPHEGTNSTIALGKIVPDPTADVFLEDKLVVPLGPNMVTDRKDVFLDEQEYIVYARQVRMKYLVKVECAWKH